MTNTNYRKFLYKGELGKELLDTEQSNSIAYNKIENNNSNNTKLRKFKTSENFFKNKKAQKGLYLDQQQDKYVDNIVEVEKDLCKNIKADANECNENYYKKPTVLGAKGSCCNIDQNNQSIDSNADSSILNAVELKSKRYEKDFSICKSGNNIHDCDSFREKDEIKNLKKIKGLKDPIQKLNTYINYNQPHELMNKSLSELKLDSNRSEYNNNKASINPINRDSVNFSFFQNSKQKSGDGIDKEAYKDEAHNQAQECETDRNKENSISGNPNSIFGEKASRNSENKLAQIFKSKQNSNYIINDFTYKSHLITELKSSNNYNINYYSTNYNPSDKVENSIEDSSNTGIVEKNSLERFLNLNIKGSFNPAMLNIKKQNKESKDKSNSLNISYTTNNRATCSAAVQQNRADSSDNKSLMQKPCAASKVSACEQNQHKLSQPEINFHQNNNINLERRVATDAEPNNKINDLDPSSSDELAKAQQNNLFNYSLDLNDTDGNLNFMESTKNKKIIYIAAQDTITNNLNSKESYNDFNKNKSNLSSLKSVQNKAKGYYDVENKSSSNTVNSNSNTNININTNTNTRKNSSNELEKKLIFVKSKESIKLNKLNEISFDNEKNLQNSIELKHNSYRTNTTNNITNKGKIEKAASQQDQSGPRARLQIKALEDLALNNLYQKEGLNDSVKEHQINSPYTCDEAEDKFNLNQKYINKTKKNKQLESQMPYIKNSSSNQTCHDYNNRAKWDICDSANNSDNAEDIEIKNESERKVNQEEKSNDNLYDNNYHYCNTNININKENKNEKQESNLSFNATGNIKNSNKVTEKANTQSDTAEPVKSYTYPLLNNTTNNFSKFNGLTNNNNNNIYATSTAYNENSSSNNSKFNYQTTNNFFSNNNHTNRNIPNNTNSNFNANYTNQTHQAASSRPTSFKVEEISNIMKRVLENNKKEAAVKSRDVIKNLPQNYLNLGKTQARFFIGSSQGTRAERPSTEQTGKRINYDSFNFIEISLYDIPAWRKHEELWESLQNSKDKKQNNTKHDNKQLDKLEDYSNKNKNIVNMKLAGNHIFVGNAGVDTQINENLLLPPNDEEVLISAYYKQNRISSKFIIDDNTANPREEINKWKTAYKKTVMRWHPDKLNPFVESLNIKDENKKNSIIKKAGVIIYNMNKNLKNIVEVLRNVLNKKEAKSHYSTNNV